MKKNLPIYAATIVDLEDGIWDISLVDSPAIMKAFTCFSDQKLEFKANEELHWVSGPVMIPDMPVYRRSEEMGEYYITFSKETIRLMAEKLMRDGLQNVVTRMHDGKPVEGVSMVEMFIADKAKGITPNYTDVPDGTLMASYKVENPEIWEQIKTGEFMGFSLSGMFGIEATKMESQEEKAAEALTSEQSPCVVELSEYDRDLSKIIDLLQDIKQVLFAKR